MHLSVRTGSRRLSLTLVPEVETEELLLLWRPFYPRCDANDVALAVVGDEAILTSVAR